MFIVRPIEAKDLDGLMNLIKNSGHGLTSLPKDENIIKNKILISERSFAQRGDRPNGESFLFVMEEVFTGKIVGVSGIISKIGGFDPYFFYRLEREEVCSKLLDRKNTITSLHLEKVHSGPAEICSLFLDKKYRNSQNGRFLSLSRFHFMANFPELFEKKVIAEMRGQVNSKGHSPFWDAVGQKFMNIDFVKADYLALKGRQFIEELLPKYPIIVNLLPDSAQEVIEKVHPNTEPALHILKQEGFDLSGYVGIFEPGPVIECELKKVRSYKDSAQSKVVEISEKKIKSNLHIISSLRRDTFMATLGGIQKENAKEVVIDEVTASQLKIKLGDTVRHSSFKP